MPSDSLKISLQLTISNQVFQIPGGNIKNYRLNLFSYGFDGELDFWLSSGTGKDDLFRKFVKPDLIEVRISVLGVHNLPSPEPDPLVIRGVVTDKSVREVSYKEVSGAPVLQRNYRISFQDTPQVLWKQHFPTELYTEKSIADILEANAAEGISLKLAWDKIKRKPAMICLGLGSDLNAASFYDFVIWYAAEHNGTVFYDYKTQTLTLSDKKSKNKTTVSFHPHEIDEFCIHFPETRRENIRVLNAYTESAKKIDITQDQAVSGVSRDIILRTEIVQELDQRKNLEALKLKNRESEIEINLNHFPAKTFGIASRVKFDADLWSDKTFLANQTYRIYEIRLMATAKKQAADQDLNAEFGNYDLEMTARMESVDDPVAHLPEYQKPNYPIFVEGKIISESGKDTDKTYQIYTNKKTSQDFYNIQVPLWNRKIKAPFIPDMTTGHFYFPAFKHARVLLAVYFDHAEIEAFLDWGVGTRLALDSQGNHILFGKSPTSETSIQHIYKDNKPVFTIQRVAGVDTELIQMEEKGIILQTQEDSSREKEDETYDVTPKVASARAQLAMEKESAIYGVTGSFESTKTEVSGKIDTAFAETKGKLEAMESEISGKIEEISADIESSMQKLSQSAGRLKSNAKSVKAELMGKMRL